MRWRTALPAEIDLAAVRQAVGRVRDPELHLELDDAGMVEDVRAGRDGAVEIVVRLTTPTCPLREHLRAEVVAAALTVGGVERAQVRFSAMSEIDRMTLATRLRSSPLGQILGGGPQVYAVASGKGGVGKSSVTANLATALAEQGQRVGVLDADVWGYSIPQLFGVRRQPVALNGLMFPVEAHRVALMSVGFFVEEAHPVVWRGPMLHKAIEQFLSDVHWGELDAFFIDLPPGTGDVALSLIELLPAVQLLVVTTPQLAAQTVAARAGRMALDARVPVVGIIENMSKLECATCGEQTALFGAGGGQELAAQLGIPLVGRVPLDIQMRRSGDVGVPVVIDAPHSSSALELRRIANALPRVRSSLVGRSLPLIVAQ